jgi:hypothetical protein
MHCGAEVTESSTNKQHHLPGSGSRSIPVFCFLKLEHASPPPEIVVHQIILVSCTVLAVCLMLRSPISVEIRKVLFQLVPDRSNAFCL